MGEQIFGAAGLSSSSFIVIVGACVLMVTLLVWLGIMIACGYLARKPQKEIKRPPSPGPETELSNSKELALLIVAALQQHQIVQKEQFNDAVRIAADKIQLRKALAQS